MATKIESGRSLVYIPEGAGPHPVLCFLHGAGEAATKDIEGTQPQLLTKVLDHRSPAWHAENGTPFVSRFLVVCPQLERRRRWGGGDDQKPDPELLRKDVALVEAVVTNAIRDHGGDRNRLVLTGFSYGGEGVFHIASASEGVRWSTLWAVDPALQRIPPPAADGVCVWVHHGAAQYGRRSASH